MANAVEKLILEEIQGIDEMLTIHAYHKQVLESLLKKMNDKTGEVATTTVVEQPNVRIVGKRTTSAERQVVAHRVAELCRKGLTKAQALRCLIDQGIIQSGHFKKFEAQMNPSHLDNYEDIFRGTKYANKN